jgi:hypothetical protein
MSDVRQLYPEHSYIEQCVFDRHHYYALKFAITGFLEKRRAFAVVFDDDGSAVISLPMVGARNPANPQPTDPTSIALMERAA